MLSQQALALHFCPATFLCLFRRTLKNTVSQLMGSHGHLDLTVRFSSIQLTGSRGSPQRRNASRIKGSCNGPGSWSGTSGNIRKIDIAYTLSSVFFIFSTSSPICLRTSGENTHLNSCCFINSEVPITVHPYCDVMQFLHLLRRHNRKCSFKFLCIIISSHSSLGHWIFLNIHSCAAWFFASAYVPLLKRHLSLLGQVLLMESSASLHCLPHGNITDALTLQSGHFSFVCIHCDMHVLQKETVQLQFKWWGWCIIPEHIVHKTALRGIKTNSAPSLDFLFWDVI